MAIDLHDAREYIERFLKIRDKKNRIVPLTMNQPQRKLYEVIQAQRHVGRPVRIMILKARQMGFSTVTEALLFHDTATRFNVDSMVIAHKEDATANLFRMTKLFYKDLPPPLQPKRRASNAQELVFDVPVRGGGGVGLNSRIKCTTAGGQGVGRSDTLTNVHMSEFAFWPGDKKDTFTGIMQAVPDSAGTMVIIESTANGFDEFKDLWDAAVMAWDGGERDGFQPVFFAWWEMADYRREPTDGFARTQEEAALSATYGLDDAQLAWRRWCIKVNCGGDLNKFRQEYPASPDEAFIASGACVFDKDVLVLRREQIKGETPRRGRFLYEYDGLRLSDIRWEDDERGEVAIYEDAEAGRPYVIGGDTAGDGSDYFVGQVLDNITGKQVAVLRHRYDEDIYARQMYCLGAHYNDALLAVESNFSTYPNKELDRLGYPRLFDREVVDTYTGKVKKAYGFRTDSASRPLIIAQLVEMARDRPESLSDFTTVGEMLCFVRNQNGKPEAEAGKHDDLVMALAIAVHARGQQRQTVETERRQVQKKLIDTLGKKRVRIIS